MFGVSCKELDAFLGGRSMDEQRMQAYVALIGNLFACTSGEEGAA